MNVRQAFKIAAKSIAAKKGRSALTMLGIIIGLAAVIILVSFAEGQNQWSKDYYASLGNNRIRIQASNWNSKDLSDKIYNYCLELTDLVVGVTPDVQFYDSSLLKYGAKTLGADQNDYQNRPDVRGGNQQYGLCNNYTIAAGRDISYIDVEKYVQVCVLGSKIATGLFDFTDPIGKTISIKGIPFKVIGVYDEKDPKNMSRGDNVVVVPYTMGRLLSGSTRMDAFVAKSKGPEYTAKAITLIGGFLSGAVDKNSGYYDVSSDDTYQNQNEEANAVQQRFLGGIAAISLLVGGIGIMNIMLVTVTERTREIGIRKAIGAERKSIISQFLIEACMICGIGGVIGIAIGFLGTLIVCKTMLDLIILPSIPITVGAFFFSVVMGVVFGLYPAIKASGLQPVDALRAE